MKFGDKTQSLQPLQTAIDNRISYYKYISQQQVNILGLASVIVMLVSMVGIMMDWVVGWMDGNLWLRLLNAVGFIATGIINIKNYADTYEMRFTNIQTDSSCYKKVMSKTAEQRKISIYDQNRKQKFGTVFIDESINIRLKENQKISLKRDKSREKKLRKYIGQIDRWQKQLKPFLYNNYINTKWKGGQFYNEKKWGISRELNLDDEDAVYIHKTCYFDSYLTNIIPGKRLLSNRNGEVILDYDEVALPYYMVEEKKILEPLGNKTRANEPGVTTLCITKDGYIYLWRQNPTAQSSGGLIVPSGSGSVDWNDCKKFIKEEDGFRKALIYGMERELWEETYGNREISKKGFLQCVNTKIIGYFRWLEKAGKPEFVGISKLDTEALGYGFSPEASEVMAGYNIDAHSIKALRRSIKKLIRKKKKKNSEKCLVEECSIPCTVALLFLQEECKNFCRDCQKKNKCAHKHYKKCKCPFAPYDKL